MRIKMWFDDVSWVLKSVLWNCVLRYVLWSFMMSKRFHEMFIELWKWYVVEWSVNMKAKYDKFL
jgi:hypothetical protein